MKLRILKGFSIAAIVCVLAACGGKKAVIAPAPLPSGDEQKVAFQVNWKMDTGHGDDKLYLNLQPGLFEGTHNQTLYTADHRGRVMAIQVPTGEVLWSGKMPNIKVISGVGVGEKNIIMGTQEGQVIGLDRHTGAAKWQTKVSSQVLSTPDVSKEFVAVLADDSRVYGLNENNGEILWEMQHPAPLLKLRGSSSPIIHNDLVFVGFANGQIAVLDRKTGHVKAQETVAIPQGRSEVERMVDINGRMAVHDNTLFAVTYQGKVMGYDFVTHSPLWSKDMSSYVGLTGAGNVLIVPDEDGVVWALNSKNGEVLWQQNLLRHRQLTAPSVLHDFVVVGDDAGNIHLLSLKDGTWQGYLRIDDSGIRSKPIIVGNTIYVYARNGTLASVTPLIGNRE